MAQRRTKNARRASRRSPGPRRTGPTAPQFIGVNRRSTARGSSARIGNRTADPTKIFGTRQPKAISRGRALLAVAIVVLFAELGARLLVPAPVADPELSSLLESWAHMKGRSDILVVGASDAMADINPVILGGPKDTPSAFNAAVKGMSIDVVADWLPLLTDRRQPGRVVVATSPLAALDSDAAEMAKGGVGQLRTAVNSVAGAGGRWWSPEIWSALWRSRSVLARPSVAYRSMPVRAQTDEVRRGAQGESVEFAAVGERAQIGRNVATEVDVFRETRVSARWIAQLRALVADVRASGAQVSVVLLPTMAGSQPALRDQRSAAIAEISEVLAGAGQLIDLTGLELNESDYHDGTHLAASGADRLSNTLRSQLAH